MITRHRLSADFGLDTIHKHKTYVVCKFMLTELIGTPVRGIGYRYSQCFLVHFDVNLPLSMTSPVCS